MFGIARHRLVAVFAVCLGLTGCDLPSIGGTLAGSEQVDVVGARTIIALVPDQDSAARIKQEAAATGYTALDVTRLNGLGLTMLSYQMPDGVTGAEAIAALEGAVPDSTVGINHAYRLQAQESGAASLTYADSMMRWNEGGCPAQVPIGVIDTAIDVTAVAVDGADVTTRSFFDGPSASARHGTEVVSVLADPNRLDGVKIFAANVFGASENADLVAGADALVRALDWLAEENVRFVNLALAGPYNKLLNLAVERAAARGLVLVAAVGNDGPAADPLYPAGFDAVIAVTAVDVNGRIYRKAVRGPHVDVAAPGVDIMVATSDRPRFVTGTSIATPFVTARLAADPYFTSSRSVSDTRKRLAATTAEMGAVGRDNVFGFGLALANGICDN
ncbi:MAG: S8 family serine peptidase [Sulfitobacter sp.]